MRNLVFIAGSLILCSYVAFAQEANRGKLSQRSIEQTHFSSWSEAINYVRQTYTGEATEAFQSSWIRAAEYYPADGRGYLIINMRGKDYIFKGVPSSVWQGFKSASSPGRYYHDNIKGRYYFFLN